MQAKNFNSTIVRLKVILMVVYKKEVCYFNSTIVRLKDDARAEILNKLAAFQFNYCTIKSGEFHQTHPNHHISIQLLYD